MTLALKAAALALACSISACASLPSGSDPQAVFDRACREAPTAYAVFVSYDVVRPVSAETRRVVRASYRQVRKTCAKPPADVAEAAARIAKAIVKIRNAAGRA